MKTELTPQEPSNVIPIDIDLQEAFNAAEPFEKTETNTGKKRRESAKRTMAARHAIEIRQENQELVKNMDLWLDDNTWE